MVKAAAESVFTEQFENQLLQHPKGRAFAVANTSMGELYRNINVGFKKSLTQSQIDKSIQFLQESGLDEITPAELNTGEGKVKFRNAMTGSAYKKFGQNFATTFLQGLDKPMASAGLGDSWGVRTVKTELGDAKAKELFNLVPTRAKVKDFPSDVFPKIKTTLMRLKKTDPESATQLLFHTLQGFRPEDLTGLSWEDINLRTGEVSLTVKTKGGVQDTTGILSSPLIDALNDLQGDQTLSGPIFADTKKNASVINSEFDKVFGKEYLEVSSPTKGKRVEPMRVKKLRNLHETMLSSQGISAKDEIRQALTFRTSSEVAAEYASSTALRRRMNDIVNKNVVAFAGFSNSASVSQWMNDIGIKNLSNKTKSITITQEALMDFDYQDAVAPEVLQSYASSGNVSGGIPKEADPSVSEALNKKIIAEANLAADEATIASGQRADEVIEAQKTLAEKKKQSKLEVKAQKEADLLKKGGNLFDTLMSSASKVISKIDPTKLKSLTPLVTQNPYALGAATAGSAALGYQANVEAAQKGQTFLGEDPTPLQTQMYGLGRTAVEEVGGLPATVATSAKDIIETAPKAVMAAADLAGSGLAAVAGGVKDLAEQPNVERTQRQTLSEQLKNFMAGMGTNLNISN